MQLGRSKNEARPKLNGIHQLLSYVDDVNMLEDTLDTVKKNAET
jgi:hypothetical protein